MCDQFHFASQVKKCDEFFKMSLMWIVMAYMPLYLSRLTGALKISPLLKGESGCLYAGLDNALLQIHSRKMIYVLNGRS